MRVQGKGIDLNNRDNWVLIIGSTDASDEEVKAAYELAKHLAEKKGKVIVSGLAKGIDTAAHEGALAGGGKTVAVLSTCVGEKIYPPENAELAERIKENGCLVFPYDTKAVWNDEDRPKHAQKRLIERDALQAALGVEVIVVKDSEEPIEGGTRWAVNWANKWGKRVRRMDAKKQFHENPNYKKAKINWPMELKLPKKYADAE